MRRCGGDRPPEGNSVDRPPGGGVGRGDVNLGGEDLTSRASEEFLVPLASSSGFISVCCGAFSEPFSCGDVFPVSGGDTIDEGYLPEYFNVGKSLYVSIINITASLIQHLRLKGSTFQIFYFYAVFFPPLFIAGSFGDYSLCKFSCKVEGCCSDKMSRVSDLDCRPMTIVNLVHT